MFIEEIRSSIMSRFSSIMDVYYQVRPIILLPFNVWFFFVSLPFRVMFTLSDIFFAKDPAFQLKEKVLELKQEVVTIPSIKFQSYGPARSEAYRRRATSLMENRPHGWYMVEKDDSKEEQLRSRKSPAKEQVKVATPLSKSVDETASLKQQLDQIEQRERSTLEAKQQLELQLEDLTKKYNSDEQVLASFEHEKQRFRNLISVEQKKCFDFQQQIIALKNQFKSEHESKIHAEEQLIALKKHQKAARKSRKASKSEVSKELPVKSEESVKSEEHVESAWHASSQKGFTEMVAEAQRDELEHGKMFSEILKEAIKKDEPAIADSKPEFTVVGGDLSSKHVIEDIRSVSAN